MINKFSGEYSWLSNFYYASFTYRGIVWLTSEHAYQAMKCMYIAQFLDILNADTPGQAKRLGQDVIKTPLFDTYKVNTMYEINKCKYEQNSYLVENLLNTGTQELIEGNNWNDIFWGVCNGIGRNELGKVLMRIRAELKLT